MATVVGNSKKKILTVYGRINKYYFVAALFLFFMLFIDENNWINRNKVLTKISEYEKEVKYYEKQIEGSRKQLNEMNVDAASLERYAREHFLMKRPDEEIYIIK